DALPTSIGLPAVPPPAPEPPPPPRVAPRPVWLMPAVLVAMVALAASLYFATRTGAKPVARQPEAPAALARTIAMKGGEMVLVEAGSFRAGEKKEPDTLPAFYIDKTEVSNAAYAQFCAETKRTLPKGLSI